MSEFLRRIQKLAHAGEIRISEHGYDELSADGLSARGVVESLADAQVVEEYPEYPKGPCMLTLQRDSEGLPVHVVWGIPKSAQSPAVLVTAYRPDPARWHSDWLRRRT